METLGDLLARERRTDDPAVRAPGAGKAIAEYTYHDFVTTGWKTANFFSHRGVHRGATVAVAGDRAVPPLLAVFGAAQLGAVTRFDPAATVEADLLVAPAAEVGDHEVPPGTTLVGYHGDTDDPGVEAFGRSVWSENPVEPPESVSPGAPAMATAEGPLPHSDLLARAEAAATDLKSTDEVAVRAPLARPGIVVAGVLAPLLVGATVVFPGPDEVCDVAVTDGEAPEARVVSVGDG